MEFRIAAEIGKDSVAKHEIETKVDIHTNTKDFFTNFGEPISRQEAKPLTFKPLFAGEGSTKSEKAYCKFFRKKYKELDASQHNWALEVLEKKRLVTPLGMYYFWPDTRLEGSYGKIRNKTSIYNYPIQGTATAEIIPIALVYFWHRIAGLSITILNTIHDSILAEVSPELVETFRDISVRSLTVDVFNHLKAVYNYEFKVPLGVGIKISPHWGDTKEELAYDIYPDGSGDATNKQTKEVKLIKLRSE